MAPGPVPARSILPGPSSATIWVERVPQRSLGGERFHVRSMQESSEAQNNRMLVFAFVLSVLQMILAVVRHQHLCTV